MNHPPATPCLTLFRRAAFVLSAFALVLGLPARLDAQCTIGTPVQFEPNPPGAARLGTLSSGFSTSLALYKNASGSPRMLVFEAWGYSTLDLTNPGSPVALKYDDFRLDPTTSTTNPVRANGDGQSYIQTISVSPDGARIAFSVNGPAEPTWHNLVGRSDGGDGFGMWGDYGDSRASGTAVQQIGARYISYATYFSNPLIVSDVTTLATANAAFTSLNLASETTILPPGYALSVAGNYVLYLQTAGTGVQIVDASAPGPVGNIASGFKTTLLANVPGDPYARPPKNYAAAVDPSDPTKLWVLVELQAWAPAGENSPSYGLVSITKDGNGNFQSPVSAGPIFRVPSSAGETWGLSGGSASLVASQGQLFAIMWATRQLPSQQFALYSSSTQTWAPAGGVVQTPQGFGLAATSAGVLAGSASSVYQYLPQGPKAWAVPMTCQPVNAPAVSSLTVANASAGGAAVSDGGTVFLGDQLTITPNVVPSPASKPLTDWRFDFDFHAGVAVEDNGTQPRIKIPDNGQFGNPAAPPSSITLVGPCDPQATPAGLPATGVGCWTSVQSNGTVGGPDFAANAAPADPAKPLKIALEATNQFGSSNTAVFTVNWKVPAARVVSSQILSGNPLTSASDGHPVAYKWYFGQTANALLISGCTGASCVPTANTNFYWLTAIYANGFSTPDYNAQTTTGLPFTVTSFVPLFTVNGATTGPITAYTFQSLAVVNNSQRGSGITANYQYYICPGIACADNDSAYVAFNLPDSAGGSATIPVPQTAGSYLLRIKANNSGPNTPARWPDPTGATGFLITVSNAPPPIVVSVGANPNPANPGDTVQLTCSATGGTGTYTSYQWSTTAGVFSSQQNPTFRASNSGSSAITLPATCTVTDSAGGNGLNTVNVVINKGSVTPLNVTASANPNPANSGNQVTLFCSASGGTGTGYTYAWTGTVGGAFSTQPNFTFTASNNTSSDRTDPYYCTVTDSGNATGQATVYLTVHGTGTPAPACTPVDYTIKDYLTNQTIVPVGAGQFSAYQVGVGQQLLFVPTNATFTSYSWAFGEGSSSGAQSPVFAYQTGGTRTATLTASGNNACTTPTSYSIIVTGPTGNFSAAYEDASTITYSNVTAFKNIVFTAFDAASTVDAYSWDFGDNTAHGTGKTVTHGFGPGSWTVKLTVTKGAANVSQTLALVVIPPPEPPKWVVPGMAYVLGQVPGTTWQSDVTIFNPDATRTATYSVAFLDARNPVSDYSQLAWGPISIAPLGSVSSPNLLGGAFGQPLGAYGALMVRGDVAPLAPVITARTFNNGDPGKGTFGLSVPPTSVAGGVSSQASPAASVLIGLRQNDAAYTNLGLVNLKNDGAKVKLEFFDGNPESGLPIASTTAFLAPYQASQISNALTAAGYAGSIDLFTVKVTILEGTAIYPYATVIDRNSTDPIVVTPTDTPASAYRVPGIIRLTGANGEKWRSRVTLSNPTSASRKIHMVFSYVACNANGCSSLNSTQGDVLMAPGQTQSWDDFVKVWLTVKGFIPVDDATSYASSTLDVSPAAGEANQDPVVVLGETYNDTLTGHVGLQIPGYTPLDGASRVGAYKRLALTGLAATATYRTNLALFVVSGTPGRWVGAHVYAPDGTKLRDVPVFVDGFVQIGSSALFGGLPGDLSRLSIVVDNIDEGVTVAGYATIIDNTSGDATFVKATPVP